MAKLFEPLTVRNVELKNRIVMSPMCQYSCFKQDGILTRWHQTHYASRAVGKVGLIILEATAVSTEGRISMEDLGIWNRNQEEKLKVLVADLHAHQTKIGIQLCHAGRKAVVDEEILAPSPIPFREGSPIPKEMSSLHIENAIHDFAVASIRAKQAGFDVIELHGAHGYLINQFLSPLTNKRTDEYGGSRENRYRFLERILDGVRKKWDGPLFVRISANEYHPEGNTMEDFIYFARRMKEQGVDLIDCSSGAVVPAQIDAFPGYQVPYADQIRKEANIATGAVGLITTGIQAEEILKNERADLIFIAREFLRDPYFPRTAAKELGVEIQSPVQYERAWIVNKLQSPLKKSDR